METTQARTSIENNAIADDPGIGQVIVDVEVVNCADEGQFRHEIIGAEQVRRIQVSALVDTRSADFSLPKEDIEKLGLRLFDDGQNRTRKVYGPVLINLMGRIHVGLAQVGFPNAPALLGRIPLTGLDLELDSTLHRLVPGHPDHPNEQVFDS